MTTRLGTAGMEPVKPQDAMQAQPSGQEHESGMASLGQHAVMDCSLIKCLDCICDHWGDDGGFWSSGPSLVELDAYGDFAPERRTAVTEIAADPLAAFLNARL